MFILVLFLSFLFKAAITSAAPSRLVSQRIECVVICLCCVCFQWQPFCPFCADTSSWEVYLGSRGQSVFLYLTSSTPATFSAQLCVLEERTCTPVGAIHSVTLVSARLYSRGQISYIYIHLMSSVLATLQRCCSGLAFPLCSHLSVHVPLL